MLKARNPARGVRVQGFDGMVLQATSVIEDTSRVTPYQDPVVWLARRARVSTAAAEAIATANQWGGR